MKYIIVTNFLRRDIGIGTGEIDSNVFPTNKRAYNCKLTNGKHFSSLFVIGDYSVMARKLCGR